MLPSFDIAGFSANSMLHLSGVDLVECSSLTTHLVVVQLSVWIDCEYH